MAVELAEDIESNSRVLDGLLQSSELTASIAEDEAVMHKDRQQDCAAACHPSAVGTDSKICQCADGRFPLRRPMQETTMQSRVSWRCNAV